MLDVQQKVTLLVSMLPYLCLAVYDGHLHKEARRVPPIEQGLHGVLLVSVLSVAWGLFLDRSSLVLPAIAIFGLAGLADELGFHGTLPRHERRLHFAAYACFAGFIAVAVRMGALA